MASGCCCSRCSIWSTARERARTVALANAGAGAGRLPGPARRQYRCGVPADRVLACAGQHRARAQRSGVAAQLVDGTALQRHAAAHRSEEHTSELQSLMRISYAVFCLKKKKNTKPPNKNYTQYNRYKCKLIDLLKLISTPQ